MSPNRSWTLILKTAGCIVRCLCFVSTKFQVARLGRGSRILPGVLISGGKNISIGQNVYIGRNVVLDASQGTIEVGDGSEIRDNVRIYARSICIGKSVTVGESAFLNGNITLQDKAWIARGCDLSGDILIEKAILGPYTVCAAGPGHDRDPLTGEYTRRSVQGSEAEASIKICRGSWTGARCVILKGVVIAENTIVGAGAVVTKNYPPASTLTGIPAQPRGSA